MSVVGAPTRIIDKNQKLKKWRAFEFFFRFFAFFRSLKYCKKTSNAYIVLIVVGAPINQMYFKTKKKAIRQVVFE